MPDHDYQIRHVDSITGRYISAAEAAMRPDTSFKQRVYVHHSADGLSSVTRFVNESDVEPDEADCGDHDGPDAA